MCCPHSLAVSTANQGNSKTKSNILRPPPLPDVEIPNIQPSGNPHTQPQLSFSVSVYWHDPVFCFLKESFSKIRSSDSGKLIYEKKNWSRKFLALSLWIPFISEGKTYNLFKGNADGYEEFVAFILVCLISRSINMQRPSYYLPTDRISLHVMPA